MASIETNTTNGLTTITLCHGKVNALRLDVVGEMARALDAAEADDATRLVVLTARGPFFSFGFDVPHLHGHSPEDFSHFLHAFTGLYTRIFTFPKPVVAAINGHAVAGGWMLAQACDARVCARGRVMLGLNEVKFGAALFAGSVAILRHLAGGRVADRVAGAGEFFDPEQGLAMGLVDEICDRADVESRAAELARERYGDVQQPSFAVIRDLVRGPVVEAYRDREGASIARFVDVWYTPAVRAMTAEITIRA